MSKNILGSDLSKHFWAGLVSGLDLSWGQTCLGAGLVLGLDLSWGWTCLGAGLVQKLRGRKCPKASGPEVSKSLGPEVSRGRTWFAAGLVLEL